MLFFYILYTYTMVFVRYMVKMLQSWGNISIFLCKPLQVHNAVVLVPLKSIFTSSSPKISQTLRNPIFGTIVVFSILWNHMGYSSHYLLCKTMNILIQLCSSPGDHICIYVMKSKHSLKFEKTYLSKELSF